jgi:hypothetical protein
MSSPRDAPTGSTEYDVFVGEIIRGKSLSGANVVESELGVIGYDLFGRSAGAAVAQDEFER